MDKNTDETKQLTETVKGLKSADPETYFKSLISLKEFNDKAGTFMTNFLKAYAKPKTYTDTPEDIAEQSESPMVAANRERIAGLQRDELNPVDVANRTGRLPSEPQEVSANRIGMNRASPFGGTVNPVDMSGAVNDNLNTGERTRFGRSFGKEILGISPNALVNQMPEKPTPQMISNTEEQAAFGSKEDKIKAALELTQPTETKEKQLYERNVYQPVMGENGKIKYEFLKTEMSNVPGDKYLQNPPQSTELPVGMEIGKAIGSLDTMKQNLAEAKDMIVKNNMSMTWLRAQLSNPSAIGKNKEQNYVINRVKPVINRLINLLSGAATSVDEAKRITAEVYPQVGEDFESYFDRLMLLERGATNTVSGAALSKKDFVSGNKKETGKPVEEKPKKVLTEAEKDAIFKNSLGGN